MASTTTRRIFGGGFLAAIAGSIAYNNLFGSAIFDLETEMSEVNAGRSSLSGAETEQFNALKSIFEGSALDGLRTKLREISNRETGQNTKVIGKFLCHVLSSVLPWSQEPETNKAMNAIAIVFETLPFTRDMRFITAHRDGEEVHKNLVQLAKDGWSSTIEEYIVANGALSQKIQEKIKELSTKTNTRQMA